MSKAKPALVRHVQGDAYPPADPKLKAFLKGFYSLPQLIIKQEELLAGVAGCTKDERIMRLAAIAELIKESKQTQNQWQI